MIVVGGGPGGSSCAAFCAAAGLKTIILDRAKFPREKVCGDCLNPECWPILERMGVAARVSALPHAVLEKVEFISVSGFTLKYTLPAGPRPEIAVQRIHFDHLLLTRAAELGAEIRDNTTVTSLDDQRGANEGRWEVQTAAGSVTGRQLVAADGRNSTVARLLGFCRRRVRIASACRRIFRFPLPPPRAVAMRFLPSGYCGVADVGGGTANLCLVARPSRISELKAWASENFDLSPNQPWRTITPLDRAAHSPSPAGRVPCWGRRASRRAVHGRRHLLRARLGRTGRPAHCRKRRRRVRATSRPSLPGTTLDQWARAIRVSASVLCRGSASGRAQISEGLGNAHAQSRQRCIAGFYAYSRKTCNESAALYSSSANASQCFRASADNSVGRITSATT